MTTKQYLLSQNVLPVTDGVTGERNVIVKGVFAIEQIDLSKNLDMNIQLSYFDNTDPDKPIKVFGAVKNISEADQQVFYQAVKATLPDINVDFATWYQAFMMEGFKQEMAATFGVSPNVIDIVNV